MFDAHAFLFPCNAIDATAAPRKLSSSDQKHEQNTGIQSSAQPAVNTLPSAPSSLPTKPKPRRRVKSEQTDVPSPETPLPEKSPRSEQPLLPETPPRPEETPLPQKAPLPEQKGNSSHKTSIPTPSPNAKAPPGSSSRPDARDGRKKPIQPRGHNKNGVNIDDSDSEDDEEGKEDEPLPHPAPYHAYTGGLSDHRVAFSYGEAMRLGKDVESAVETNPITTTVHIPQWVHNMRCQSG